MRTGKSRRKHGKTQFELDVEYAKTIVDQIGEKKSYWNVNLSRGGRNVETKEYSGYGLKIKYDSGYNSIVVTFNNYVVLQYPFGEYCYNIKPIYNPGGWESVLIELYNKLFVLTTEKENKEYLENHKLSILRQLIIHNPSNTILGLYNLRLESHPEYSGYENEYYRGTYYTLYYNDEIVFKGFNSTFGNNIVYTYVHGSWESKLDLCITLDEMKKEEAKRKQEEDLINDSLRRLREL